VATDAKPFKFLSVIVCDFIITSAIGVIALFTLTDYPECAHGHRYIGYNDDKQEIVCWGYLQAPLVEVTDLTNSYSVIGIPEAPSPTECDTPNVLPPADEHSPRTPDAFPGDQTSTTLLDVAEALPA